MKPPVSLKSAVVAAAFMCVAIAAVVNADFAPKPQKPTYITWGAVSSHELENGVYGKCREYWLWKAQLRQFRVQNKTCPFGPFAANIVNHHIKDADANVHIDGYDCGKWIESNSGRRGANVDPGLHAEVEAGRRLMECTRHPENCVVGAGGVLTQTQAQNKTYWGQLTMYSTGESCAMDAANEAYYGYGEVVFGFPTPAQLKAKWPLTTETSKSVYDNSRTPTLPKYVIGEVELDRYDPYYTWQFDPEVACPHGCARNADGSSCIQVTPLTELPEMEEELANGGPIGFST